MDKQLSDVQAQLTALQAKSDQYQALHDQLTMYRTTNPPSVIQAIHDELTKLHGKIDAQLSSAATALGMAPEPVPAPVEEVPQ